MSTTAISAGQIMDRVAILLNDPNKTDYTYTVMIPYLNMAIDELAEYMEESNAPITNVTNAVIDIPKGYSTIVYSEFASADPLLPKYPSDLVEIQEVGERTDGSLDPFKFLTKKEFQVVFPASASLLYWTWEGQIIRFNPNGALGPMEIELKYISQGIPYVATENTIINMINSRSYLSFKTAAFCCMFIGENETRAQVLDNEAERAIERTTAISNKGKQQIMTRHRPFRANYKARGWL